MASGAKRILGVVAAIAIPFVAPMIVTAITGSSMFAGTALASALGTTAGATAGSSIVGAGLGAVAGGISGQGVGQGALLGAIGGGIGGYASAGSAAQGGVTAGLTTDASLVAADASNLAAQGLSEAQIASTLQASHGVDSFIAADAAGLAAAGLDTGAITQNLVSSVSTTPAAGGSFASAVRDIPATIASKFSDPKVLADMTLRAGASLLTGQFAGSGLSEEEQQLLQQQTQSLELLRQQDEELFRTRLNEAMELLGEAKYFDPERYGLQAQNAVKVAGTDQLREAQRAAALREGRGGGMSEADTRRAGLDITARGQTAYLSAAEQAQRQRLSTYQAGLQALPRSAPSAGLQNNQSLAAMYDTANQRKRELQEDIGGWFGSLTGQSQAKSLGGF